MNRQTAETVRRAAGLISTGEIVELGHVLQTEMPLQSTRQFHIHLKQLWRGRRGMGDPTGAHPDGGGCLEHRGFTIQDHAKCQPADSPDRPGDEWHAPAGEPEAG
jgi:hypothetical protein